MIIHLTSAKGIKAELLHICIYMYTYTYYIFVYIYIQIFIYLLFSENLVDEF